MITLQQFEHGGNIQKAVDEYNLEELIDFSANINPYGLAKSVREAIINNIDEIVHYPEPHAMQLREALGRLYNLAPANIVVGNGAVELIYILCQLLQPRKTLIISPSFSEYERASRASNSEIQYAFLEERLDYNSPMRDIIVKIKGNDLIFLCNPNNPTGTLYTKEDVELLIEHAENNGAYIVVDESFMEFIRSEDKFSVLDLVPRYHNLMVLRSMTKFYALPGLRLGFAVADEEVLVPLYRAKDPWNVNTLAQKAGLAALADTTYQRRSRTYTRTEINYLYEELLHFRKLKVYEPTVNFILAKIIADDLNASSLREQLLQQGILIRDCSNYPGLNDKYIRFAVRTRAENDALIDALEAVLGF